MRRGLLALSVVVALTVPLFATAPTLSLNFSDNDHVFTTLNGGGSGVHTGVPNDGDEVQVFDDEAESTYGDVILSYTSATGDSPNFRSGGSALMKSGLTEVDFNGSADRMRAYTQIADDFKGTGFFLNGSNATVAFAIYPEAISNTSANPYENEIVFADTDDILGCGLYDSSGTKKVRCWNYDGSFDSIEETIATGAVSLVFFRHGSNLLKLTVIDSACNEASPADVASNVGGLTGILAVGKSPSGAYLNARLGQMKFIAADETGSDLTTLKDDFKTTWLSCGGGGAPARPGGLLLGVF